MRLFLTLAAALAAIMFPVSATASSTATVISQSSPSSIVLYTPPGMNMSDSCMTQAAGSFSDTVISIGLNWGRIDHECELRKEARALADFGFPAAGVRLLCLEPRVQVAMAAAGTPCELITAATYKPVEIR